MTKKQKLQLFGLCFSILVIALIIRNKSNNINIETSPVNNKTQLINCSSVDLKNLMQDKRYSILRLSYLAMYKLR